MFVYLEVIAIKKRSLKKDWRQAFPVVTAEHGLASDIIESVPKINLGSNLSTPQICQIWP
jgi:hypothetical protein